VVVDTNLKVLLWNHAAKKLWGLLSEEVIDRPLLKLDLGLLVKKLKEHLLTFLGGKLASQEVEIKSINRKGKAT
jgi:PAS domain S-box-containing protein